MVKIKFCTFSLLKFLSKVEPNTKHLKFISFLILSLSLLLIKISLPLSSVEHNIPFLFGSTSVRPICMYLNKIIMKISFFFVSAHMSVWDGRPSRLYFFQTKKKQQRLLNNLCCWRLIDK